MKNEKIQNKNEILIQTIPERSHLRIRKFVESVWVEDKQLKCSNKMTCNPTLKSAFLVNRSALKKVKKSVCRSEIILCHFA
jgi:hypothetical protein